MNSRRVLQVLFDGRSSTISEISQLTSLSRPTVNGILNTLVDGQLVQLDGHQPVPMGGRPANRYAFNDDAGHLVGLDIGAHAISVCIATLSGVVVGTQRTKTALDLSGQERLTAAESLYRSAAQAVGAVGEPWAIGVGTPGIIDPSGVVRRSVPIPAWNGMSIADELSASIGSTVEVVRDTSAAVLAEHRRGAAQEQDHVLYLHAGHRIGVGMLVDGKVFSGGSGAAGEIGRHTDLGWAKVPSALLAESGAEDSGHDMAWVFDQASSGDARATRAVDAYARSLASGIGAMVLAVDPEIIVIGGGLAAVGPMVGGLISRALSEFVYDVPRVVVSTLGADAVTLGSVEVAKDQVLTMLFAESGSSAKSDAAVPTRPILATR